MEGVIFNFFLALHIVGGSTGLITGTINLVRTKGGKRHKLVGKLFAYGMLVAGFSSFVLATIHPSTFLFMTGMFTVYMVGTGYRYVYLKMLGENQKPTFIDWFISLSMFFAGLILIGFGFWYLLQGEGFGLVFVVFGTIGLAFVRVDYGHYRGIVKHKNYWLVVHLQRMTGGYIASITAFLAVNSTYFPDSIPTVLYWLLPTAILTPLIVKWSIQYKSKDTSSKLIN